MSGSFSSEYFNTEGYAKPFDSFNGVALPEGIKVYCNGENVVALATKHAGIDVYRMLMLPPRFREEFAMQRQPEEMWESIKSAMEICGIPLTQEVCPECGRP